MSTSAGLVIQCKGFNESSFSLLLKDLSVYEFYLFVPCIPYMVM